MVPEHFKRYSLITYKNNRGNTYKNPVREENQQITAIKVGCLRVLENRVLKRIFGPKTEEMVVCWRRHHVKLHNLYASPNSITMITLRRMRWARHVAHMGDMRNAYDISFR
jgi:hypothetical protein